MSSQSAPRRRIAAISTHVFMVVIALIFLIPLLFAISSSLKPDAEIFKIPPDWLPHPAQWSNYPDSLRALPFGHFLLNTLLITIGRIVGLLLSCSLAAYAFARLRWRGRNVLFGLVLATMMIPAEVTILPQYLAFSKIGWVNTFLPLIVPGFFANNAFYVFLLRQFFATIPRELDEAAWIDGAGYFRIYWQIILPLAKPALAATTIFIFQANWVAFLEPLIYLQDQSKFTLSLGLGLFQEQDYTHWGWLMSASLAVSVPIIIVFFLAQRHFVRGWTFSGIKG
jgi:multiple sugar transport system permease protein